MHLKINYPSYDYFNTVKNSSFENICFDGRLKKNKIKLNVMRMFLDPGKRYFYGEVNPKTWICLSVKSTPRSCETEFERKFSFMICITNASSKPLAFKSYIYSPTGLITLYVQNVANDTIILIGIQVYKRFLCIDRVFASWVGQQGWLISYYAGSLAVSHDLDSLQKRNCVRN